LPDTNYWHYCLQLNTYKAILEQKYGRKVRELYLVCLHPDNKNGSYQRIKVVDLQEEVGELFQLRKNSLNL
jgi:CRISPR/Cas system-associated exonuclease Cas4 (RecB family)